MNTDALHELFPGAPSWLADPECWAIVGALLTTVQWGASIHPSVHGTQLTVTVRHLGSTSNPDAALVAYVRVASEARARQLADELSSWLATVMLPVPSTQVIGDA